jgi:hypothetical protein
LHGNAEFQRALSGSPISATIAVARRVARLPFIA